MKSPEPYVTDRMLQMLANVAAGEDPAKGIPGLKPAGVNGLMSRLVGRGMVAGGQVTDRGREFLKQAGASHG